MKQLLTMLTVLVMSLTACAQKRTEKNMSTKKTLVAYFSATGTTKQAAEKLAKEQHADLFEIEPAVPYTDADLNWRDKQSRSTVEMADKSSRPAIKDKALNVAQYDTIYVGFPIWWYVAPTIVNTFVEKYNLDGKVVVPFATSGGSSIDGSVESLKKTYPNVKWQQGKMMNNW